MKKAKKAGGKKHRLLKWGIVLLVLFLAVHFGLGHAVKLAVESIGPHITGTTVKLGRADVYLILGYVRLLNLEVGNPKEYQSFHALTVKKMVLDLAVTSLFSRKKVVEEFTLDGVDLYYEQTLSSNNLSDLLKQVQGEKKAEETSAASAPSDLHLQIDRLSMTDIDAHVVLAVPGVSGKLAAPVPMPPIVLNNLGTGKDGITLTDLTLVVMDKLVSETGKAVGGIFSKTTDSASKPVKEAVKKADDFLRKVFRKK